MHTTPRTLRDRYNAFIFQHEVAWELTMAAFAVVFVVVGYLAEDAPDGTAGTYITLDLALTALFAVEFGTRLAASYDRRRYLRSHWIDAVALIPMARGMRALRILRLLRLVRAFAGVYRALASLERFAQHRNLLWLFSAWLTIAMLCSAAMFLAESGGNPMIATPGDAAWWGIVTLATVGYGDIYPITPEGRIAGAALIVLGITLFAAITGTITSLIVARSSDGDVSTPAGRLRSLEGLRAEGLITDEEYQRKRTDVVALL